MIKPSIPRIVSYKPAKSPRNVPNLPVLLLNQTSNDSEINQNEISVRKSRELREDASYDAIKLAAVCNLAICSTSPNSIKISWQSPEIKCPYLCVKSVRINCNQIDNINDTEQPIHIFRELPGDALYHVIENLPERTKFRINVSCSISHKCNSSKICGRCRVSREKSSAEIETTTWGTTPATDLKYKVKTENSVLISWKLAKVFGKNKVNSQVFCYRKANAKFDAFSNESTEITRINLDSSKKSYLLSGLKTSSEYIVWIESESSCRLVRSEDLYVVLPNLRDSPN